MLTVRVIAPAGPFDEEAFVAGVDALRQHLQVRYDQSIFQRDGYLAGPDSRRLQELKTALRDEDAEAILCVRGGYGSMRLLRDIPRDLIQRRGIPIAGFSDITALHLLWASLRVPSIHCDMVAALGRAPGSAPVLLPPLEPELAERTPAKLTAPSDAPTLTRSERTDAVVQALRGNFSSAERVTQLTSRAEHTTAPIRGTLLGGNLSLVAALAGTSSFPQMAGAILFLEEIGERAYRLDRLLTSLSLRGIFDEVSAVVFGDFTDCFESSGVHAPDAVARAMADVPCPVFARFPAGHGMRNVPLAFGLEAELSGGVLSQGSSR